jgi:glyoxylate reductase
MAHIFVTRTIPGAAPALLAAAGHTVEVFPEPRPPLPAELAAALARSQAALTMVTDRIDGAMLDAAPSLRVIANLAVGYDNVDPEVAAAAGVWLTNTPGVLADTTADFAFALLLAAARNVALADRDTRAGGWTTWSPTAFLGTDVHGATLGIIGMGEIGQAMARRAAGFSMRVLYNQRHHDPDFDARHGYTFASLPELLEASDFVSLHTPLTPQTRGLMSVLEFAQMKPTAILINTARGLVVDQPALIEALREGQIAGAALDVTDPEPLPLANALYSLPNVIITPHIASASLATRSRMAHMAATNILAALGGEAPPNAVNRPPDPRP